MSELSATELVQQGLAHHQQGELDAAEGYYKQALEIEPGSFNALHFFGMAEFQKGQTEAAERLIEQSIELCPDSALFRYNYGQFLESQGRDEEALWAYDLALTLDPTMAAALNEKGRIQHQAGHEAAAENAFREAIALDPRRGEAYTNLGGVLWARGDLPGALHQFTYACALEPPQLDAYIHRVDLLEVMGRPEEAITIAEEARGRGLAHPRLDVNQARAEQDMGRLEACVNRLEGVLRDDPGNLQALYIFAPLAERMGRSFPREEAEALLGDPALDRTSRGILAFALGAHADSQKRYDEAFQYWLEGNQMEGERADARRMEALLDCWQQIRDYYSADVIEQLAQWGNPEEAPIFVVGTPRSGTTLIEQILASHSEVAGVGESGLVEQVIREYLEEGQELERGGVLNSFPPERLAELGSAYMAKLRELAPGASRIVEKTPGNAHNLGLIRALFPNARVIFTHRNPLDAGVSMFSLRFTRSVEFAFDLETLGRYLHGFGVQAAHWREVLPGDFLMQVEYADVVSDPEAQIRNILDHCGLSWEPACLRFFETERPIQTASQSQARSPIYRSSVERWPRYAAHLLPLARAAGLETELPREAREGFRSFSRLGVNQLSRGQVQEAIASLRRALMWEPGRRGQINVRLGRALELGERFVEAEACFALAEEAGVEAEDWPGEQDWRLARVRCLRKAEALEAASAILEQRPSLSTPKEMIEGGWLAHFRGDLEAAEHLFEQALEAGEDDDAREGWIRTLRKQGRGQALRQELESRAEASPDSAFLARMLADLLRELGALQEAETWARRALDLAPRNHKALTALAACLFEQDRPEQAAELAEKAVEECPDYFVAYLLLAYIYISQERFGPARARAGLALALRGDPDARRLMGKAMLMAGDEEAGLAEIQRARREQPDDPRFWLEEAAGLEELNRRDEALAVMAESRRLFPESEDLHFLELSLQRQQGAEAEVLEGLLSLAGEITQHPRYLSELGFLYDRQGYADRAYACFKEAKDRFAQWAQSRRYPKEPALSRIARLRSTFTSDWTKLWKTPSQPTGWAYPPVFLLGFPRSGTTLLDQILSSHSEVEVIEEKPVFGEALGELRRRFGGDLKGLVEMGPEDIREVQELYRERLDAMRRFSDARMVVDKMPLRTVEAGMVHRLFPDARFIFARRHPADCVLSGFMQLFRPNPGMANFNSLAEGARFYRYVMELWDQYRSVLPDMKVHEVRYEELLEDFDGVVGDLLGFLGLDWEEGVRAYRDTAMSRGRVATPSRTQVTQPLYRHARYRWRRYRQHFGEAWGDLLPFIRASGYLEE
jgi:tetratricopeptide (TPR) repeat protein